jgi:putative N6-adenine-specific DNA methylase
MLRGELQLFAPCPRGLEAALADELTALGASACRITGGGVAFAGDAVLAMAANLHSRIASRILMQVAWGRCRDEDSLYKLVRGVEWERWFNQRVTLRVDVSAHRSPLRSLNFATLRVKDAICDRFRESTGVRPSIDTRSPDVRVFAYLDEIDATIYLDLSGESLFKRGWRGAEDSSGAAPLKENLAAGLLALAGWQPSVPLHDPLCGSGTLLIEAAQRALAIAPGRHRRFGFEKLRGFDALVLADLKQDIDRKADAARPAGEALQISGSDIDPRAIERTRRNLERAGIPEGLVSLWVEDFGAGTSRAIAPGAQGILLTNPPYGERLFARANSGTDMSEADEPVGARPRASGDRHGSISAERKLAAEPRAPAERRTLAEPHDDAAHQLAMQRIGARLRRDYGGWRACVLSPDPELPRQLGMQPKRRIPLFNGAIECRLFCFEIFERSPREANAAA